MGSIPTSTDLEESTSKHMTYPAPLEDFRGDTINTTSPNGAPLPIDIETPILIVGGGPVGMLQALMLARLHHIPSVLIERELSTTTYPKMEYTNGRSAEIYRQMGLIDDFRALSQSYVPDSVTNNELVVTGMVDGVNEKAKLIRVWERPGVDTMKKQSREQNDGSQYLEPHLRIHQIPVERWLKSVVEREKGLIESHWGWQFLGLEERKDGVVSEIRTSDGRTVRIKSRYVVGTDGGGSWVRKSVGLESKRNFL